MEKREMYPLMKTAHNWINVKDFKKTPKAELIGTFTLCVKYVMPYKQLNKIGKIEKCMEYMMASEEFNDAVWKGLKEERNLPKCDYVVPSYFSDLTEMGELMITIDCFKKVRWWEHCIQKILKREHTI